MSQVIKPIFLDETGKEIVGAIRQQNALISAMARGSVNSLASSWKDIHNIVRDGLAPEIFHIGDQLIVPWKDVAANKTYEVPLDIVHFGDVTLKGGTVVPAMFLQWHYCTPFAIQFNHEDNERATESTFSSDYYYYEPYTSSDGTNYKLLVAGTDYSIGETIQSSKVYYHSAIKDPTGNVVRYGYNRWSKSALRQFLNSDKGVNEWWTPQYLGNVAPTELSRKAGFMSGFEEDFLSCLRPTKITTALNIITDADIGTSEDTYDTFFVPSLEQIYGYTACPGIEGEAFEYWRQAVGKSEPNGWDTVESANPAYITYSLDTKSATLVRIRSASARSSYSAWCQIDDGRLSARLAIRRAEFNPVCAIC